MSMAATVVSLLAFVALCSIGSGLSLYLSGASKDCGLPGAIADALFDPFFRPAHSGRKNDAPFRSCEI